jgi:hypothetical protein
MSSQVQIPLLSTDKEPTKTNAETGHGGRARLFELNQFNLLGCQTGARSNFDPQRFSGVVSNRSPSLYDPLAAIVPLIIQRKNSGG